MIHPLLRRFLYAFYGSHVTSPICTCIASQDYKLALVGLFLYFHFLSFTSVRAYAVTYISFVKAAISNCDHNKDVERKIKFGVSVIQLWRRGLTNASEAQQARGYVGAAQDNFTQEMQPTT